MHTHAQLSSVSFEELRTLDVADVRTSIRSGAYSGHTAGLGLGKLQCNLAILTTEYADDFLQYCTANPRPCPLMGMSRVGEPVIPYLGEEIDLRTDLPGYNVYRFGKRVAQHTDISDLWQDDFVAFAIGCSFTFENAILKAGIKLRHIDQDHTVPMFRTSIDTIPSGPFSGGMVVSMRPFKQEDVPTVAAISARYAHAHGDPVHVGDPSDIGIADIAKPDWGDPTPIHDGEVPVFWACGVTPQSALEQAQPPICITHLPGCMLLTDVSEEEAPAESPFSKSTRERKT